MTGSPDVGCDGPALRLHFFGARCIGRSESESVSSMISMTDGSRAGTARRGRFLGGLDWRLALCVRLVIEEPDGSGEEGMSITCIRPCIQKGAKQQLFLVYLLRNKVNWRRSGRRVAQLATMRADYDPRRVCLNPFPDFNFAKYRRTIGIYLAGALVRCFQIFVLCPSSVPSLHSPTGPSSMLPSSLRTPIHPMETHRSLHQSMSNS